MLIHVRPIQGPGLGSDSQHIWLSDRQKTVIRRGRRVLHCLQILDFTQFFSHPPLQECILLKCKLQSVRMSTQSWWNATYVMPEFLLLQCRCVSWSVCVRFKVFSILTETTTECVSAKVWLCRALFCTTCNYTHLHAQMHSNTSTSVQ